MADLEPEAESPYGRALQQMFELYVTPAVNRRQAAGELPRPLDLRVFQIVFGERQVVVRVNDEVEGEMKIKPVPGREKREGDPVYMQDVERFEGLELPEHERDNGHFTAIRMPNNSWTLLFDFRRNRAYGLQLVTKADEFLASARLSYANELWSPFQDSLFSACELLAKAELVLHILSKTTKSHGRIHTTLNHWGKLGNIRGDFVAVFNRLSGGRAAARYSPEPSSKPIEADTDIAIATEEAKRLRSQLEWTSIDSNG